MVAAKQLEKKLSSEESEKWLLKSINENIVRKCGEEHTVVGSSVWKVLKSVHSLSVRMEVCISRAIPKRCLKAIPELNCFCGDLRRNWRRRNERGSRNLIHIRAGKHVVPLHAFLLVRVGTYKRSFACYGTVLVYLAEVRFERSKWTASLKRKACIEEVLWEASDNRVMKALLKQSLFDVSSGKKSTE